MHVTLLFNSDIFVLLQRFISKLPILESEKIHPARALVCTMYPTEHKNMKFVSMMTTDKLKNFPNVPNLICTLEL